MAGRRRRSDGIIPQWNEERVEDTTANVDDQGREMNVESRRK